MLKNQTEIPAVSSAEKSSECACYVNNLTLDAQSPICQIYKVSRHKAFYSHYLNGGAGGIVFTRFHISDADAFGNANQTGPENFPKHCRILRHELKILVIKTKSKSGRCRTLSGFLCRQQSEKRPLHRRSSVAELCGQRAAGSPDIERNRCRSERS